MVRRNTVCILSFSCALTLAAGVFLPAHAQEKDKQNAITSAQRMMAISMLENLRDAVQKDYYDPALHGVNLPARYETYKAQLAKAPTLGDAFRVLAAFLSGLNDSHTFFDPPPRSYDVHYGYRMRIEGDRAFIAAVRPGSDAAVKLHPGDEIVKLEGYSVNRKDAWQLEYFLDALAPRGGLHFSLLAPDGTARNEVVKTKFIEHAGLVSGLNDLYDYSVDQEDLDAKIFRQRWMAPDEKVFVWKMPNFEFDPSEADSIMGKAKSYPSLVLDLRGNPGGLVDDCKYLLGYFVTHKITVATPQGRKHQDPEEAKPNGDHYPGKLFVVVDSGSASASEIFARTVQLEHLGTVIGDTTAGAVMESNVEPMHYGDIEAGSAVLYGASITVADMIMPDGKSLEKVGVTPDVEVLPTAADMAGGRDSVLAKAVELAGGKGDPAELAKSFPVIWAPYGNI
ncbi:MAG TPA: S41 family peptidase [Terriglobales bacterium]|nr:S41 family peptidase [Terriglobales bacterium]